MGLVFPVRLGHLLKAEELEQGCLQLFAGPPAAPGSTRWHRSNPLLLALYWGGPPGTGIHEKVSRVQASEISDGTERWQKRQLLRRL